MENTDSNPKPQTGGLKMMTVFILVLALHVLVIGGITIYHLVSGGSTDADLVSDKPHKGTKATPDATAIGDAQIADANEKAPSPATTSPAATPADSGASSMTIPVPAGESNPTAGPDSAANTPPPSTTTAPPVAASTTPAPTTSGPVTTAPAPTDASGPMTSNGPVVTPPAGKGPAVAKNDDSLSTPLDTGSGTAYTVKSHDSLARIAHRHHITVAKLKAANDLKSDMLHIGQKLTIPGLGKSTESDTGLAALREPNTTMLGDDPMPGEKVATTAHEKSTIALPASSRHVYTVSKGDTLSRIAHRFHTTANAIMALNNISDARKLRLGQKLKIPSQESRSATSSPTKETAPQQIEPRATPSAQLANFVN